MQTIIRDENKTIRFKRNSIVRYLLEQGGLSLNDLAVIPFKQADWEQFYQLIGYSLCGYHELSNVSDESAKEASEKARAELGITGEVGCRDRGCEIHCGVAKDDC